MVFKLIWRGSKVHDVMASTQICRRIQTGTTIVHSQLIFFHRFVLAGVLVGWFKSQLGGKQRNRNFVSFIHCHLWFCGCVCITWSIDSAVTKMLRYRCLLSFLMLFLALPLCKHSVCVLINGIFHFCCEGGVREEHNWQVVYHPFSEFDRIWIDIKCDDMVSWYRQWQ